MDHNYTVSMSICILSMIILAIDVGKNTILNKSDIKWFRLTFILAATGAGCEYLGFIADHFSFIPPSLHLFITFTEFCISPYLGVCLARSSGMKKSIKKWLALLSLNVVLQVISLFNGIVFYIDSEGIFHRGPAYLLYLIFGVIDFVYLLFVFVLIGIRSRLRYLINIFLITFIMIIGQVANAIDDNIKSGYMSICVTATLFYICIQNILRHLMIETINMEKDISNHDALTKVHSRVSYNATITDFDKQIEENPETIHFAICECDLNNLKIVNDSFGHEAGDKYIVSCSKIFCHIFKHSPVFRIGGDEFVIIIQNEDYNNFNDLKKLINDFTISEMKKEVSIIDKNSFAAGFAVYDYSRDKCFADVFKRADAEMYENKKMLKSL